MLIRYPLQVIGGVFAVIATFANFYLSTAFALSYGAGPLGYGRQVFLEVQLGAIGFMAVGILLSGWWADKTTPRSVLMWGCGLTALAGLLLAPMMGLGIAAAGVGLPVVDPAADGLHLRPARRLSARPVSHTSPLYRRLDGLHVGGILGGGLTPLIATTPGGQGRLAAGRPLSHRRRPDQPRGPDSAEASARLIRTKKPRRLHGGANSGLNSA
ncbi:MAG: hypothetical protein WDN45_12160 [Caulobacteraceae bacterium]